MASPLPQKPRRVLIVGGGASGLVTLRNLVDRGEFAEVVLVERRNNVGGVWYREEIRKSHSRRSPRPFWPSPAYPGLVGNVLPEYLSFSHYPFPAPQSTLHPFPTLEETHAYLRDFATPFLASGHIRLSIEVVWVDELPGGRGWRVTTRDWSAGKNGEEHVEEWDAVVVATAWYDYPFWPEFTPGLVEARAAGLATHAQMWDGPAGYKGKRVVVVGNANSANDIAAQLAPTAQCPVYRSIRRQGQHRFAFLPDPRVKDVPPITRYTITPQGRLDLQLRDGSVLTNIDTVIVATGYSPAAARFVRVLTPSSSFLSAVSQTLTPLSSAQTSPPRIPGLYNHILYAANPSLAFIGTILFYTPFTLGDLTSTWLALFFSGRIAIPDTIGARLEGERARIAKIQRERSVRERAGREVTSFIAYYVLGADEQGYAQGLRDAVVAAAPEYVNVLPEWNDAEWARREGMYALKWDSLRAARDAEVEARKRRSRL